MFRGDVAMLKPQGLDGGINKKRPSRCVWGECGEFGSFDICVRDVRDCLALFGAFSFCFH